MSGRFGAGVVAGMCAALLALLVSVAVAEDYVLGADDVIQISVWLHPELERTVTIGSDGTIVYPPIGTVQAGGLTPKQLGDRLADKLGSFLRQTTAVTVTVSQFMSHGVTVTGAVAKPGRYGFERVPSIVDAIGQAGGVAVGGDLSRVQIVRREGAARRTIDVDVSAALRDPTVVLPELRAGDTIMVPGAALPGSTAPGEGVGVIGQVTKPGLYPVTSGQDIWSVLAAAGGIGPTGDLSAVNVITRQGSGQAVLTLNLKDVLKRGTRSPFLVKAGDVVYVGSTTDKGGGRAWAVFQQAIGVSRDLIGLVLIRDIVNNR